VTPIRCIACFLLALGLAFAQARAADEPPAIESLMAPEDFSASGLNKLTEAELEHLSEWVERYREGAVKGPEPEKTSADLAAEKEVEISAKVIPAFTGWSGKTLFRLDNGQVWQQRQSGKLRYSGDDSSVLIYQNLLGGHMLKHIETGRAVGVKRIR
jgi:hypothetical protein